MSDELTAMEKLRAGQIALELMAAELERLGWDPEQDQEVDLLGLIAEAAWSEAEARMREQRHEEARSRGEATWRAARQRQGIPAPDDVPFSVAASLFGRERPPVRIF